MEKLISGPLAVILEKNRHRYNTLFAMARQTRPALDNEILAYYLWAVVQPIVNELDNRRSANTEAVVGALYEHILNLMQTNLLGTQSKLTQFEECWKKGLIQYSELIVSNALEFLIKFSNALFNICSTPNTRPADWIERLISFKSILHDISAFQKVGFVAAWQSGMAHYRSRALQILSEMSDDTFNRILLMEKNTISDKNTMIQELINNPWKNPQHAGLAIRLPEQLKMTAAIGGFTGYGGPFLSPPVVSACSDGIIVHCRNQAWLLHADFYGHVLQIINPYDKILKIPARSFTYYKNGTVDKGNLNIFRPELEQATSFAGNDHTFAITSRFSHSVYLFAVVET
jgi:hypothetical protein